MEELINKLNAIPNSYFGFVAGIVTYAKRKPERLQKVMDFLNLSDNLTPSDVVKFVMSQRKGADNDKRNDYIKCKI